VNFFKSAWIIQIEWHSVLINICFIVLYLEILFNRRMNQIKTQKDTYGLQTVVCYADLLNRLFFYRQPICIFFIFDFIRLISRRRLP